MKTRRIIKILKRKDSLMPFESMVYFIMNDSNKDTKATKET
jgi:hypothetical protein